MKTKLAFLISLLTIFCYSISAQPKYDTLTNKTIVSLTKIGLPAATIISKIKSSVTSFDVSVDALVSLQENGVNGEVINEMIKIDASSNTSSSKEMNSNNPNVMHKPGIYYFDANASKNKLVYIDPSVTSSQQSGGYSYNGIGSASAISELAGKNSKTQIDNVSPDFYFYFENNSNPDAASWFFATATSPKEFVLIKLNNKKQARWVKTGSSMVIYGSVSNKSGVSNKDKIDFGYEIVSEGIYKVTFDKPLESGEYCFMYASQTPSRYNNDKLFDFGIPQTDKKKNLLKINRIIYRPCHPT
jgi:hypothetical protein